MMTLVILTTWFSIGVAGHDIIRPSFRLGKSVSPGGSKPTNELSTRRLSSRNLKEVNWATGKDTDSSRPVIISTSDPDGPPGNFISSFSVLSRDYSEKLETYVQLPITGLNFTNFQQKTAKTARISVTSTSLDPSVPELYWLFFVDKNRRLYPHLVIQEVGAPVLFTPSAVLFSHDGRFAYLLGSSRSKLVVQAIKNPVLANRK